MTDDDLDEALEERLGEWGDDDDVDFFSVTVTWSRAKGFEYSAEASGIVKDTSLMQPGDDPEWSGAMSGRSLTKALWLAITTERDE